MPTDACHQWGSIRRFNPHLSSILGFRVLGFRVYSNVRVIGIMEKKMETTILGSIGIIGYILGLYIRV